MNEKVLATIRFGRLGEITLAVDGTWTPSADSALSLAKIANRLSRPPFYEYSPAHGGYGALLANRIAKKLGGTVELPEPVPGEPPEGVVF